LSAGASAPPGPGRTALFVTCLVDLVLPRVGLAALQVLRRLGVEPEFPRAQTCCGQPAFNAGFRREARLVASHFLRAFEGYDFLVAPSGSCAAMVRDHYPRLFEDRPELAARFQALGRRTYELSQFITEVLGASSTGARFPRPVTYHDSCHSLRSLGVREGPRRLIREVEGIELRELPDSEVCCGFGGTFSVKYPHISMAMADDKIARIEATGADFVVATDLSCLLHIGGALERRGSRVRTLHLAELLAQRG
jgi:L-lactate dehydrogenase complex protein LldE